jgi:hemerythrin-like domain-containing protein
VSAVLLPGQSAAPAGPIDLSMMYVLHHGFRRDLARFVQAGRRTPVEDAATWRALLERWDVFATLLHDHHHKEDEHVWPLLRTAVAGDADAFAVLDAMEAEHGTIDPLLDAVRERLVEMNAAADPSTRDALERLLTEAWETLDHHLGHEERDAIALIQRHVVPSDWARLDRTALRGGLGPRELLTLIPWSVEALPQDVTSRLLREVPPFRIFLWLGRWRFARLERAAFRHVPAGTGASVTGPQPA